MYRFHASGAKATRHPSINDAERKRLSNASRFSLGLGLGKSIFQWTISPPIDETTSRIAIGSFLEISSVVAPSQKFLGSVLHFCCDVCGEMSDTVTVAR